MKHWLISLPTELFGRLGMKIGAFPTLKFVLGLLIFEKRSCIFPDSRRHDIRDVAFSGQQCARHVECDYWQYQWKHGLSMPQPFPLIFLRYFLSSCRWWQLPYYWVGIKLYDLVAGSQCLKSSYVLSKSKALELFPMLRKDKLVGAIVYYDGMFFLKI